MEENFINLLTIAGTIGKVTYAMLAGDGSIFIDVEENGVMHQLSYTSVAQENSNENP